MVVIKSRALFALMGLSSVCWPLGCASTGKSAARPEAWPMVEDTTPRSRADLKNAGALDLSYARWQEQVGNLPEAERTYQRVLEADPKSLEALLGLARLEQLAGRSEQAERHYRRAATAAPNNPAVADALGQFYAAEGRWPDAIRALARAAESDDPIHRHHYAVALVRSGRPEEGLAQFTRIVREPEAHYNVGHLLYEQQQHEQAERHVSRALALDPQLAPAGQLLVRIGAERTGRPFLAGESRGNLVQTSASMPAPAAAGFAHQTGFAYQTGVSHPTGHAHPAESFSHSPGAAQFPSPTGFSGEPPVWTAPSAPNGEELPLWQRPVRRDVTHAQHEQQRNQIGTDR